jgi:hypothetical protein
VNFLLITISLKKLEDGLKERLTKQAELFQVLPKVLRKLLQRLQDISQKEQELLVRLLPQLQAKLEKLVLNVPSTEPMLSMPSLDKLFQRSIRSILPMCDCTYLILC